MTNIIACLMVLLYQNMSPPQSVCGLPNKGLFVNLCALFRKRRAVRTGMTTCLALSAWQPRTSVRWSFPLLMKNAPNLALEHEKEKLCLKTPEHFVLIKLALKLVEECKRHGDL